jgi:NCAIR mutase (PurE)-related protein
MTEKMNNYVETTNTPRVIAPDNANRSRQGRPRLPMGQALTNAQRCQRHRIRREEREIAIDRRAYEELIEALGNLAEALDKAKARGLAIGDCFTVQRTALLQKLTVYIQSQT